MMQDYRIDAGAIEKSDVALAWAVIEPIWMLPTGSNRSEQLPRDWDSVTSGQLCVYAATWVEREVLNGGFWQYLHNTAADLPLKALEGFRAMGMEEYARLLEQAIAVFPAGVLPRTRRERRRLLPEDPYEDVSPEHRRMLDRLVELDGQFYDRYEEGYAFYRQMAEYVRAHPEHFFCPD